LLFLIILIFPLGLSAQWYGDGLSAGTAYCGVINAANPMPVWTTARGTVFIGSAIAGQNDLEVATGGTLTIQPGVTVKLCTTSSDLRITGTGVLNATGTSLSPVVFTKDSQASWGHISFEASTGVSVINYCTIEYGRKTGAGLEGYGGGIQANTNTLTISNSTIRNNYGLYGGGLFVNAGRNPAINNCYVYNNQSLHSGGGFYFWNTSSSVVTNCIFDSNHCLEPSVTYYTGGGLAAQTSCAIKVVNCTFVNNTSTRPEGQALLLHGSANSRVINSIFWGVSDKQIYCYSTTGAVIINSAYRGITYTTGTAPVSPVILNSSNSAPDGPNFTNPAGSDWSITFVSPCRDAGINSYTGVTIPALDYIGNPTIYIKDIGAYEVQYSCWKGPGTSWAGSGNWYLGMVPTTSSNINIPSGMPGYPDNYSSPPDVTIGSGKYFYIHPGARVTVNTLANNGTINLYSNATAMFSLLIKDLTGYSGSGTVNTQLYLSGGVSGTGVRRHYLAVPSQQAKTVLISLEPYNLLLYDDSKAIANKEQGWVYHDGYPSMTGGFSNLYETDGYSFYHTTPVTATFTGTSLMESLGTKNLAWFHFGWNLVGNSLTCGINWDDVSFSSPNINRSVYFMVNGQVASYVQGGPSANGGSAHIPPLQGFFVKTTSAGTSLNFDFSAREHHTTTPVYSKGLSMAKSYKGILPLIRLAIGPDSLKDETVVWFNDGATMNYDNLYDAAKWLSSASIAQLYSLSTGAEYSINGIPFPSSTIDIPLAVKIPANGTYSIRQTQLDGVANYDFYLVDLVQNTVTNLNEIPEYSFTATTGTTTNRFIIRIMSVITKIEEVTKQDKNFSIYSSDNWLNILPLSEAWDGLPSTVKVLDLSGRTVIDLHDAEFRKNSVLQVPSNGLKGMCIVEIRSGAMRYVGKVVMK